MREKEGSRLIFRESKPGLPNVRANEMISPSGISAGGGAIPAVAQLRQASKKRYITFEAGMCMKTKERLIQCPKKIGHLGLNFGHFCLTDGHFAENCHFATTDCQIDSVFLEFLRAPSNPFANDEPSGSRTQRGLAASLRAA